MAKNIANKNPLAAPWSVGTMTRLGLEIRDVNGVLKGYASSFETADLWAAAPKLLAACKRTVDAMKDHVLIAHSLEGAQTQGREICSALGDAIAEAGSK